MTRPQLLLKPDEVHVYPGGHATATVTITNQSRTVEGYAVRVLDEALDASPVSTWTRLNTTRGATAEPTRSLEVAVYPGESETVTLTFAPDLRGAHSGRYTFGVHVASVGDPFDSDVVEGELEIRPIPGLQAVIVPVTATGRWRGRHTVTVSNTGNSPARLRLIGRDPDDALGYLIRPALLTIPVGQSATARLDVRTRRPRLRGQSARLSFAVVGEPDPPRPEPPGAAAVPDFGDPSRPVVNAAFVQKPILSAGLVACVVLAVAALGAGAAFALTRTHSNPAAAEQGVPPTPVLAAAPGGAAEVQLSWAPVPGITDYKLLQLAGDSALVEKSQDLDPTLGVTRVGDLSPGVRYCFQLLAKRGATSSPPSAAACASAGAAQTTSPTTSSTSTFGSADRIVMVYLRPFTPCRGDRRTAAEPGPGDPRSKGCGAQEHRLPAAAASWPSCGGARGELGGLPGAVPVRAAGRGGLRCTEGCHGAPGGLHPRPARALGCCHDGRPHGQGRAQRETSVSETTCVERGSFGSNVSATPMVTWPVGSVLSRSSTCAASVRSRATAVHRPAEVDTNSVLGNSCRLLFDGSTTPLTTRSLRTRVGGSSS